MALQGEAKKAYQRELMRKRRAIEKGEDTEVVERVVNDLPWPYNREKPPRWGEGVPVYIPPTEEERKAVEVIAEVGMVRGPMRKRIGLGTH